MGTPNEDKGERARVDTGGGAHVDGDAQVSDGGFLGRDQHIHGDQVYGDKKVVQGDEVLGDKIVADQYVQQVFVTRAEVQDVEDLEPEPGDPPYKGLHYFEEEDADLFFGRERLTAQIVGRLHEARFLAIVGASGSGKSSLVRAGVIPALRRGEKLVDGSLPPSGSGNWSIHVVKPASTPLQSLADTLTRDESDLLAGLALRDQLAQDARILHLAARKLLARQGAEHLLLVVDQFEELFTLCEDEGARRAFLDNLLAAVSDEARAPITVIVTLRADFYAQCGRYDDLRQVLSRQQEYIGAMSRDEMFDAIVKPVARSGQWKIEKGLPELILEQVGSEPGALSLLSHALLETWKRRRGHILTLSGYTEAGGVRGAIAQTAEAVYEKRLTEAQKPIARNIFLRLTELGDGTQDTRRRATREELITSSPDGQEVGKVLDVLTRARLVIADRHEASGAEVVEVAHEALIRHWERLRDWLDEDRRLLRLRQGVQRASLEWMANDRDESYLDHRDERLEQVTILLSHARVTLDDAERAYLEACQRLGYLAKASIAKSGWGVIFARDADPAIRYALRELLDHRQRQATEKHPDYYHEFIGKDGYHPGETKREFLARHGVGASLPTPDRMPYYLLIVGDPETIPFSFQYQLDMQYAVGRIHFDTLDEYAQYARSVVKAETEGPALPRRVVVFAPQNAGDRATAMSLEHLAVPIAAHLEETMPEWTVQRVFKDDATKARLGRLLGGDETPSLLFSCGHGMEFRLGHASQLVDQGALLCQEPPGSPGLGEWRGEIPKDFYFAADDVGTGAQLLGSIFYFWSCFGAATPKNDNFAQVSFRKDTRQIAPHAFLARLPQRLLGHPRGGALAVIGSVERKWGYSFAGELGEKDLAVFLDTLLQLMEGYPVGAAMEFFNQRYTALMAELIMLVERSQFGEANQTELAQMWTATNDARNYIIVGDPAVRLRVDKTEEVERLHIEPGLRLEPAEQTLLVEIEQATAAWEANGRQQAGLQHEGEKLQQIEAYGTLLLQDEAHRAYVHACRQNEQVRQEQVLKQRAELHPLLAQQGLVAAYVQSAAERGIASDEQKQSLTAGGWGVIFAHGADPAVREALQPLLEHRRQGATAQDARYYREFSGLDGYCPGESAVVFLHHHGVDLQGQLTPETMPYYLLIVGSPEEVPFQFQYDLALQYAVGRIHFEGLQGYADYAASVVSAETEPVVRPRQAVVFAPQHQGDTPTHMALEHLVIPVADHLEAALPEWTFQRVLGEEATKACLGRLQGGDQTPALLFSVAHGAMHAHDDVEKLPYRGAIVCSDWPGVEAWSGRALTPDLFFSGDDVGPDANLAGSIAFFFGSWSAGTPAMEDFAFVRGAKPQQQAPHPFLAPLAGRLLGLPRGALAVIGHVDQVWGASFVGDWGKSGLDAFQVTLTQLAQGMPVGAAMEAFNRRYARLYVEYDQQYARYREGEVEEVARRELMRAGLDARNYIVVGDPAVRLRTAPA